MGSETNFSRILRNADVSYLPLNAQIELTGRCNLACRHCYLDLKNPVDELSQSEWVQVLDQLAELGTMFLCITGGEIFLRKDAMEIAAHARSLGMGLRLLTSGTRVRAGDLDRIAALHPMSVELSLYAGRAEVHDFITQRKGSHRKTLRAAVGLRRRGVPVLLKAPILAPNADHILGVIDIARRIGADYTFDTTTITRRDGRCEPIALRASQDTIARVLSLPELQDASTELSPKRSLDEAPCTIARSSVVILPNGDVMACSLHPEPAGNVRQRDLRSLWYEAPLLTSLRRLTMADLSPTCSSCEKNNYCSRCGALALLENGDFLGPSSAACDLAAAKEQAAGLAPTPSPAIRPRLPIVS